MIDKVETIVPFFTGFYNSIFEDYWNHKDEVGKIFTDNINDDIKSILPSFSYTFEKIQSPKYYNYGRDEIYALATFDTDELLNYLIKNGDKFEEYCKNNFSSYDGFVSFLPNNAYEFVEKMKTADASDKSSFVLGAISFVLENNYGEEYPDDLNHETYYDIVDSHELDSLDDENPVEEGYDDKFDRLSSLYEKPKFYVADENDEFIQGGFDSEEEAQNWIYKYCNDNAITPEDFVVYPEEEAEDGSKLYYDDKLQRLTDLNEAFDYKQQDKKFQFQLLDRMRQDCEYFLGNGNRNEKFLWAGNVDDQIKAMRDLQSRLNPEWLSKEDIDRYESQMKDGKKLDEATDKLEESEYANVDTNPFRLVRQGDGCIALQRKLPDGRIERAGLFDSDEKEEALNKLAEINGVKQIDESSIVDRYSKPSEKDVKPELKNDPSVQEMVKVVLDNWDNYNDGEKATLKSAIFNASLGECGQLKKLYRK